MGHQPVSVAWLTSDAISRTHSDNIVSVQPDYYAKRTLHYCIGERHPLVKLVREYKSTVGA
jgi:hypothetical protein